MDHKEHPHQSRYLWHISLFLSLEADHKKKKKILIFSGTWRMKNKFATCIVYRRHLSRNYDFSLLLMCSISHLVPSEFKHKLNKAEPLQFTFKMTFCTAQIHHFPARSMKLLSSNITWAQMLLLFSNECSIQQNYITFFVCFHEIKLSFASQY